MRPVDRGPCPQDGGRDVVFGEYGHARPHLIGRLGDYCSFCEAPLLNPAVEHVRHKDHNPALQREWSNFLLACTSCNSTKGIRVDTQADVEAHLWPDRDRTFDAFTYRDGAVSIAHGLDPATERRAQALADLVGLLKLPDNGLTRDQVLRGGDRRWEKRYEAWREAEEALVDWQSQPTTVTASRILAQARPQGFFSIWYTVFAGVPEVLKGLPGRFPGTATDRLEPGPSSP